MSAHWSIPIKGDIVSPPLKGDIPDTERVTPVTERVTPVSPEPSLTVNSDTSIKRLSPNYFKKDWEKFLLAWAQYFPHKVQPRVNNLTLQKKLASRLKDDYFKENYHSALYEAAGSDFVNTSSWMQADWFLKNDSNWEKCLNGNYKNGGDTGRVSKHTTARDQQRGVLKDMLIKDYGGNNG